MPRMETLGLSDSSARSYGRFKSLFWPSIQNGTDVDYLETQGYWVCTIVAAFSFRERSRYAALAVLLMYALDSLLTAPGVVRILITALLFSNLRATWMASNWEAGSEAAILPPRMAETLGDKFADRLPQWLWPKVRIPYHIFAGVCWSGLLPQCYLRSEPNLQLYARGTMQTSGRFLYFSA